jgi:hypothetical protein
MLTTGLMVLLLLDKKIFFGNHIAVRKSISAKIYNNNNNNNVLNMAVFYCA